MELVKFIEELNSLSLKDMVSSNGFLEQELEKFDFKKLKSLDLEKFSPILWKLIEANYHTESLLLTAFIVDDSELISLAKAVKTMQDSKHYIDIAEVKEEIFELISTFGQNKFGAECWNKHIFS